MSLPVASIIEARFNGLWDAQRIMLTMHYQVSSADSTYGIDDELNAANLKLTEVISGSSVFSKYLECLPALYAATSLHLQPISPVRHAYRRFAHSDAGAVAGEAINTVTGRITLASELSFPGQWGTKQIGPVPESMALNGVPHPTYAGLLSDLGEAMLADMSFPGSTIVWKPCIYHRLDDTGSTPTIRRVGPILGTQRRRLIGKGV